MFPQARSFFSLAALLLIATGHLDAAPVITVAPGQSIKDAITNVPDGGIIELAAGTYQTGTESFNIYTDPTFPPAVPKTFTFRAAAGANVTLTGAGATDILRFVNLALSKGKPIYFERINFVGGRTTQASIGGAVSVINAEVTFTGCTFQGNFAGAQNGTGGGGVWIASSVVSFLNCTWDNNTSPNFGGGVSASDSRVYFRGCKFTNNRVNLPGHSVSAAGGAVYGVNSTIQVANCSFDNNQAGLVGGALYLVGDWANPTASLLTAVDSEFTGNIAQRDGSVNSTEPEAGGAIHVENQVTLNLTRCRFTNNIGRQGGAINLFKTLVNIDNCVFRGNHSTGTGDQQGFGGTIMALSPQFTNAGPVNHRPVSINITDTLFDGGGGTSARQGGCIFAAGDLNAAYGLAGVTPDGTPDSHRGILSLTRVAIFNCNAVGANGLPGSGGAIFSSFLNFTADSVIIANCTSNNSGGALQLNDLTTAKITKSSITDCKSGESGAAITMFGGTLNATNSIIERNSNGNQRGAATTTAPSGVGAEGKVPASDITGTINGCTITDNTGSTTLYDGDSATAPYNRLQYTSNNLSPDSLQLYIDDLSPFLNVTLLNTYIIPRSDGTTTKKGDSNVGVATTPDYAAILMIPRSLVTSGGPTETLPIQSYLAYATAGKGAVLDGAAQTNAAGFITTASDGAHTLTAGSATAAPSLPPAAALNISTRLPIQNNDNPLIGGFIIGGTQPKRVVIRGIGPSLSAFGLAGIGDPVLELHDSTGATIATNDNWKTTQTAALITQNQGIELYGTGIAPSNDLEPAMVVTLDGNKAYTAVVKGANGSTGTAVVEAYDVDTSQASTLANLSTRGFVQTGNDVMIGGFILGGGAAPTNVVVRAIGPSLSAFGVSNALSDPTLELRDVNGNLVDSNDNWSNPALTAANLAPKDPRESAILRTDLARGAYTAIVRGNGNAVGTGLVEVYVF